MFRFYLTRKQIFSLSIREAKNSSSPRTDNNIHPERILHNAQAMTVRQPGDITGECDCIDRNLRLFSKLTSPPTTKLILCLLRMLNALPKTLSITVALPAKNLMPKIVEQKESGNETD